MFNCQKAEDAIFNRKRLDNLICCVFQNCAEIVAISVKS